MHSSLHTIVSGLVPQLFASAECGVEPHRNRVGIEGRAVVFSAYLVVLYCVRPSGLYHTGLEVSVPATVLGFNNLVPALECAIGTSSMARYVAYFFRNSCVPQLHGVNSTVRLFQDIDTRFTWRSADLSGLVDS